MKKRVMNPIKETVNLVNTFKQKYADKLKTCLQLSEKLIDVSGKVERSWSGSFAGWHGSMYYHDFQIPSVGKRFSGEWGGIHGIPEGWNEKQPEQVLAKLEELIGGNFSIKQFENDIKDLRKAAEDLQREISIIFSFFDFSASMIKENELLVESGNFLFGNLKNMFICARLPKRLMSRDMEALRQGICTPVWLYYEGLALEGKDFCTRINNFFILIDRLVRQLEGKIKLEKKGRKDVPLTNMHLQIYSKCHELYGKGAYAEAVEKSFKVVRDRLRKLTEYETGSDAFGKGKLHIKGAAAVNVDKDFNNAVKYLTMAIDQFRNEKSHTSDAKIDDPVRAYEYLRLSSLAMNLLEDAEILT